MIYVLVIIIAVCALGAMAIAFSRTPRRDDVERFHRARAMTTEWSRRYAATGHLELPNESGNGPANGTNGNGHAKGNGHANGNGASGLEREREHADH